MPFGIGPPGIGGPPDIFGGGKGIGGPPIPAVKCQYMSGEMLGAQLTSSASHKRWRWKSWRTWHSRHTWHTRHTHSYSISICQSLLLDSIQRTWWWPESWWWETSSKPAGRRLVHHRICLSLCIISIRNTVDDQLCLLARYLCMDRQPCPSAPRPRLPHARSMLGHCASGFARRCALFERSWSRG
jgi:hypothetical protein